MEMLVFPILFVIGVLLLKYAKSIKEKEKIAESLAEYERRSEQKKRDLQRNVEAYERANSFRADFGPKIYAYTTPEITSHNGWTKIGYTEQSVMERIKQQVNTADVEVKIEWYEDAVFADNKQRFSDKDFHAYLRQRGYKQKPGKEWFEISPETAKRELHYFKFNHGKTIY